MPGEYMTAVKTEPHILTSVFLQRDVILDCYLPVSLTSNEVSLLLVNDGQDLRTMKFEDILDELYSETLIGPLLVVAVHCASDRKNEYGTARYLDYKGRGAKAFLYTKFVFEELLPFIRSGYAMLTFKEKSFAGFSLGGLCALDIVWNHPHEFTKAAVFSGSLWWRDKGQDEEGFNEDENRIMQRQVREGAHYPWLKFFFEVGTQDEVADRNNNGIIDSIDDTQAVIREFEKLGYQKGRDLQYLELKDGRHDVQTWSRAFPYFLCWAFGEQ